MLRVDTHAYWLSVVSGSGGDVEVRFCGLNDDEDEEEGCKKGEAALA